VLRTIVRSQGRSSCCRAAATSAAKVTASTRPEDYVTKPFGMAELVARIRAALRHRCRSRASPGLHSGDLSVDLVRRIVRVGEADIKLSPKEYDT